MIVSKAQVVLGLTNFILIFYSSSRFEAWQGITDPFGMDAWMHCSAGVRAKGYPK